jgi:hypothetical protein
VGRAHDELEVLVPSGEGGSESSAPTAPTNGLPPVKRRRWPIVVIAAAVVAAAVAAPVRDNLARRQLRWLERQWAQVVSDDNQRFTAEQGLSSYRAVTDASQLDPDIAALYSEEAQRFETERQRVHGMLLVDHGLSRLRRELDTALDHRSALLAQVAAWYEHPTGGAAPPNADDQTATDIAQVETALRSQRTHWRDPQPAPTAVAQPYRSATAALAHLSHWLDQPVGARLLSGSGPGTGQLVRLDVDASRVVALPSVESYATPRQGYLAYAAGGQVWAVAADGSGPRRRLAAGDRLFAADNPQAIWVADSAASTLTEVDGAGRILLGPVTPPGILDRATSAGLVVVDPDHPGIAVWNPADAKFGCRFLSAGIVGGGEVLPLAAHGHLLAWASATGQLHLSDVATCADRSLAVANTTQAGLQGAAAFSPDGLRLAVASYRPDPLGNDTYSLNLVDIWSGQVAEVPLSVVLTAPITALAWTPDGARLFWMYSGLVDSSSLLETWRLGDRVARPLRAVRLDLTPPLSVVP